MLCVLRCACGTAPDVPVFAGDFTADISFSLGGREYAASYTKASETETLVFHAPERLCGMTAVRARDRAVTVTIGDLSYAASAAEGIFDFAKLLAPPDGVLRFAGEENGMRCFSGSDGTAAYTVYTDISGLPLRFCGTVGGREYDIQILQYERSDP